MLIIYIIKDVKAIIKIVLGFFDKFVSFPARESTCTSHSASHKCRLQINRYHGLIGRGNFQVILSGGTSGLARTLPWQNALAM
jgi:hypothetical protein